MTQLSFSQLDSYFRNNDFPSIENDERGTRYLMLRSMSRRDIVEDFCTLHEFSLQGVNPRDYLKHVFELGAASNDQVSAYLRSKYVEERARRQSDQAYLVDQLARLQYFDWGGSFGNSLEKNIVNNYVKKIRSFDRINEEIEGNLLSSLKGYTLNSWYNHWTSILIEDIFKDHPIVLPTIGLVTKIDFFIHDIPFDLKVTYFPEELLANKLMENGFGNELTQLKRICRELSILIPSDLKDKALKLHLYSKVVEDHRPEARQFIARLRNEKQRIIQESKQNPADLKKWFYENQGEARFDASNRFFLVLIDESEMQDSWKLKRNISFLTDGINQHLNSLSMDFARLDTSFYWAKDQCNYSCKSDILFLSLPLQGIVNP
jgi:hypothetical protein